MANSALQSLKFIRADGKPASGLVPTADTDEVSLSIDERVAVTEAKAFDGIDFVFFRRLSDGRSSQVAAYVVDNSEERIDEQSLAKLHLQVWLHGKAPLLYIAWPSRIDVLACARGADFWPDGAYRYSAANRLEVGTLETAAAIADEIRRFSAFRLADGTFWEDSANARLADYKKAAHQSLIQAVVEADADLDGEDHPILRRLLVLMVLVKYLEDRSVFPDQGWFGRWHKGARSFFEVLKGGDPDEVYALLDFLERKFNGDVFRLPENGRQKLTKTSLRRFAELVEARTLGRQQYLWGLFSFEHLPVEIISHLYQRFVQGGHGTVYTPPFLASLLLDHAMPYEKLTGKERVLDPACGSGVFLVGAFRRLVNVWRSRNGWRTPDVQTLKEILRESIHGSELDSFAVDLAAFSLSLAVCDALKPDSIWNELQFDRLRDSNLHEGDFFTEILKRERGQSTFLDGGFDLVIGNPPFESKFTEAGKEVNRTATERDSGRSSISDKQAAYLFLEQAMTALRPSGRACLIQPSGFLYNRGVESFRNTFFGTHRVEAVFDFTSVRNLYDAADTKTVAILAHSEAPELDHSINHWTFRRTASVHKRICFELDHYDRHRVPQRIAESDPYVWRANLLGGGRLLDESQRLRQMRTLAEYVEQKGWDYGEGFIVGNRERHAPFLTGRPHLLATEWTAEGIEEDRIKPLVETHFQWPRRESIFRPPLILIKRSALLPMAMWQKGFLAYDSRIVGIHAPPDEERQLLVFYEMLRARRRIHQFSCLLHSTEALVVRSATVRKQDIDSLPYPTDPEDLSLSFWEEALSDDVLSHMAEYVRLGQNSELLKREAEAEDLEKYSRLFIRMLGSVYDNLRSSDPVFLDGLICQPFYFGSRPNLAWLSSNAQDDLRILIYDEERLASLRTVRVLRFYSENVLLLVKPDRLRYWIRSTAIRDADETLVDLRRQGY
jgi:hypothetical protein